jgi:tRNA-2-methylthio-N6-dimethylallyladenosine synthase
MKKIYIRTFGCQMNDRDSELIYGLLLNDGYIKADTLEDADVVLFNTCSVRKHAEDRVYGNVGLLRRWKQNKPTMVLGILGCMAQSHGERIFQKLPHVDFVCGPADIYKIPDLISQLQLQRRHLAALGEGQRPLIAQPGYRENPLSAHVSISEGCDNFCSYCIVPYVRGREQSRPKRLIVDEVQRLAEAGYKEVTLLGQNVNSYRSNKKQQYGFINLLEDVNAIQGIERIRFITSHPKDATKELFQAMKDLPKVCEHLHLPMQSGSNAILKKMRRRYTQEKYLKLVETFRKIVPASGLSTDIIVGFPGERENDFKQTYATMKTVAFDSAFIFKYSPRPPARASAYDDDVAKNVKEKRNQMLLELQKKLSRDNNARLVGAQVEVLVGSRDNRRGEGYLRGRTRTNKIVVFRGDLSLLKTLVNVTITSITPHRLIGEQREN